jgi:hypothetical protein
VDLPASGGRPAHRLLAPLRLPRRPDRGHERGAQGARRLRRPPPLLPTGLLLRRDGSFVHEGERVTHPRIHRALLRGVRFLEEEGVFVTTLGRFRGQIDVEDTAFFAVAFDPASGDIDLSDGTSEPLDLESLRLDADGVLRCQVKGRWPARFTQTGQAHLLDRIEVRGEAVGLRTRGRWLPLPGLRPPD